MSSVARPANPTIAQIKEVTQPESIVSRANSEHWLNNVYLRRVSPYLTRTLIKLNVSPNAVTFVMIGIGKLAALSLLINGVIGAVAAAVLAQFQMVVDCSDGEVARWQNKFSPKGIFLDKVAHYTVEGLVPVALGIRAAGGISSFSQTPTWWPFLGACLAVLVLLNKSLNDAVHVSRALSGMDKLADVRGVSAPRNSLLNAIRNVTRVFPFQRIFHSIEMTAIALLAAIVDSTHGNLDATRHGLVGLTVLAAITLIGHFISIMSSSRLA